MTQHDHSLDTLLVLCVLTPLSLLQDLERLYKKVIYAPLPLFAPHEGFPPSTVLPTPEQFESADAIIGLFIPPNLTSVAQTPNLKLWQCLSAGYAHITSTPYFKSIPEDSGLIFASASGIHVSAIGEHVIATSIAIFHKLNEIEFKVRTERKWYSPTNEYGGLFIRELRGQTVGIIGYGHIGRETARLASAFGAQILALTRSGVATPEDGYIIPGSGDVDGSIPEAYYSSSSPESLAAFLGASDVVVDTLPSSAATQKFIGESELRAMKGDSILVNIGRGDTVDTEALVKALTAKKEEGEEESVTGTLRIGGASLDVTDPEPLPDNHALFTLPNALVTPHCSGGSIRYFVMATDLLTQNTLRLREGKGAFNAFRGKGE